MKPFISSKISRFFSSKTHIAREIIIHCFYTVRSCSVLLKQQAKGYHPSCSVFYSTKFITNCHTNKAKGPLPGRGQHISSFGISFQIVFEVSNDFCNRFGLRIKSLFLGSHIHPQTLAKKKRMLSDRSDPNFSSLGSSSGSRILNNVFGSIESKVNNNHAMKRTSIRDKGVTDVEYNSKNSKSRSGKATAGSSKMTAGVVRLTKSPNTIVVLHPKNNPILTLDICVRKADELDGLLTKSMFRDENEAASKVLNRICMLYAPDKAKGSKGQRLKQEDILNDCPKITVMGIELSGKLPNSSSSITQDHKGENNHENNTFQETLVELDTTLPNRILWKLARLIKLGEEDLTVKYNIPTIKSIEVPSKCFVGLPLMCIKIETLFVESEKLHYEWCLCHSDAKHHRDGASEEGSEKATDELHVLSTEPVFIPTEDHLGKHILLRVGANESDIWTQVKISPVQEPPPAMTRWQQTTQYVSSPSFRVVTYNILHDDLCTSMHSKTYIYPFATDAVLDIENRKVSIFQELLMYHADLICLQECGQKLFERFLEPALGACGYGAYYKVKCGAAKEGCALFYRKARFELMESEDFTLNWQTLARDHPEMASRLHAHPALVEALERVSSIGVALLLREVGTGVMLVLGTTHLYYHANACHVRILQAYLLLHRLHRIAAGKGGGGRPCPVVLCGDFNCTHPTGAYRLVTTGQLEAAHVSWEKGGLFHWGGSRQLGCSDEELRGLGFNSQASWGAALEVKPSEKGQSSDASGEARPARTAFFKENLHAPLALMDAYDRTDPSMPWTNYTLTFREVIDYIFFSSDSIDVVRTVPIPPESELCENHALPNAKYPSDHLALIADLILKQ